MQLFKNTNIDFLGKRPIAYVISAVLVLGSIGLMLTQGLNYGIDFSGGTEVQIKMAQAPDLNALRPALEAEFGQNATIQSYGPPEGNELLVRVGQEVEEEDTGDVSRKVIAALRSVGASDQDSSRIDLNSVDSGELTLWLARSRGDSIVEIDSPDQAPEDIQAMASAITEYKRTHHGLLGSLDELSQVPGLTPEVIDYIEANGRTGEFAVRRVGYVGPSVGEELRAKARQAIVLSLGGILLYIWFRFELAYAVGAIAALAHDVTITLGAFSLSQLEFNLPVVAAVLTIVGYSLNDTIVIFDRIRENRLARLAKDLVQLINRSINQTLGRTVLTSMTTLCVVLSLLFLGGETFRGFAFSLLVGVLIGTYSSVFVASPVLIAAEGIRARRRAAGSGARKVGAAQGAK